MRQKQKNLLKLWAKKSSVQLMGDLTGVKSERILRTGVCIVQKYVQKFLVPDEWIKREWPKIVAGYSPEDTMQMKQDSTYFSAMPECTYLFKNESA
jgi:hypothetical protein